VQIWTYEDQAVPYSRHNRGIVEDEVTNRHSDQFAFVQQKLASLGPDTASTRV